MVSALLTGCALSALCGLDRTAAFQFMLARPIVAAPLTGLCLGDPLTGLQIGCLIELLWLGRLPMGAAIPPDDTQVAVGATFLALVANPLSGPGGLLLATMVALPLGKVGEFFDRWARRRNAAVVARAEQAVAAGAFDRIGAFQARGALNFVLASLATFLVIILGGGALVRFLAPVLLPFLEASANWLRIFFPLVGIAFLLAHIHVSRALTLFASSFLLVYLLRWLP